MFKNSQKRKLIAALFAVLTVGAMSLFFKVYDPWTEIGPNRITDGQFEAPACTNEWTGWNSRLVRLEPDGGFNRSGGVVLSVTPKKHSTLKMTVAGIENIPAFKVSIRAAAQNVQKGCRSWYVPRAVFFFRNQKGKALFNLPHQIFKITQDATWKKYVDVFPVPENARDGQFQIQNLGAGGILSVDDLSITPVRQRASTPGFNLFFIALWFAALAACLIVLEPWQTLPGIAALFFALIIIVGVILPQNILDGAITETVTKTQNLEQRIERPAARPATTPTQTPSLKKRPPQPAVPDRIWIERAHRNGHFTLFMILAFCSILRWTPSRKLFVNLFPVTAGLILFAASTETLQFITIDREPGLGDLGVDITGVLIAVALTTLTRGIIRYFHKTLKRTE